MVEIWKFFVSFNWKLTSELGILSISKPMNANYQNHDLKWLNRKKINQRTKSSVLLHMLAVSSGFWCRLITFYFILNLKNKSVEKITAFLHMLAVSSSFWRPIWWEKAKKFWQHCCWLLYFLHIYFRSVSHSLAHHT